MPIIALEEHLLTSELSAAWADLDASRRDDATSFYYVDEVVTRLLDRTEQRLAYMDDAGVDVQVLSLTTPGVQSLFPAQAVAQARLANDVVAELVRAHPSRFQGLAALPTPDPQAAAEELRRAVQDRDLRGAMLFGRTGDRNLDHPANEPIFEAADAMGVPLYVHAQTPPRRVRDAYYSELPGDLDLVLATVGLGWHYEAGLQFVRLALAGVLDRYPNLHIILGHWGDLLPFYLEELDKIPRIARTELPTLSEYIARNASITPSGVLSSRYLAWAIEVLGAERLMFSLDYPFGRRSRVEIESFLAPLDTPDREKITARNWEALTARARV